MAVEKHGSKTDVVVKLVLVFFVCLLSFSIGTFVGKKFSDNQHKLAKFEPTGQADREVASIDPNIGDVKPNDALTDDEVAKLAEEFVSDDESGKLGQGEKGEEGAPTPDKNAGGAHIAKNDHDGDRQDSNHASTKGHEATKPTHKAETPAQSGHGKSPASARDQDEEEAHEAPVKTSAKVLSAAEKVARNEAPVQGRRVESRAETQTARIPSSLPKEMAGSAIGKFTVQVASYPEETEAKKMAGDLKGKGFSAFYVSAKVRDRKSGDEKTWYRVSVGLFQTQKEADAYKNDLLARSKVTSAIVQKITE